MTKPSEVKKLQFNLAGSSNGEKAVPNSKPDTKDPPQENGEALQLLERAIQKQKIAPINLAAIKRPRPRYIWNTPLGLSFKRKINAGRI